MKTPVHMRKNFGHVMGATCGRSPVAVTSSPNIDKVTCPKCKAIVKHAK